jgi:hypothetical protein
MSNKEQLEKKIAELKKGLASGEKVGLPANVKQNLEKLLSESEKELAELEKEPKKDEPKKEATKEPKIKSKVAAIKKSIKKEPQEKKEKPKSALERCKDLLSRYKKQKKTSSVRAEKRRKAGKPATLTPAEAVSKTAKSVKVKVVSIKEKTDAGLSKGEINKMVSGIVSTIKATLDGIVTSADKNEFLREIQAEIRELRTDMPKVAEMGGSVDFNEGAGMFAKGGGISDLSVGDKVIIDSGYSQYDGKKAEVVRIMPDNKTLELKIKHKVGNEYIKFEKNEVKKYAEGGATEFTNSGAGMFANGGGLSDSDILSKTIVYDNNGKTFDRYTIFTPDGSVYGMSENATGFNQYLGEKDEVRKGSHLGKKLTSVPEGIKSAVLGRMRYEQGGATDFNEGAGMFAKGGFVVTGWTKSSIYTRKELQQDLKDHPIFYITMYNRKAVNVIDKILKEYGIKVDVSKEWHTKGYGQEYLVGSEYGFPFDWVIDVRDAINPIDLMDDLWRADREYEKDIALTASKDNVYEEQYAKGGIFGSSRYNSGRSWHQDRARHNKSEKWEKPLSERKSK